MARTLYVNDTDLATTGRVVRYWEGPLGAPELIGDSFPVPFRPGLVDVDQTPGGREIVVGLTITGSSSTDFHDKHRTLSQLVWYPQGTLTLKREITLTGSTETVTCNARFIDGLQPEMVSDRIARYALRFVSNDGYWYATTPDATTVSGTTGSIVGSGTARTNRVTLTFTGINATQTFSNTTTGATVVVTGDKTTHDVVLDVDDFTATQNGSSVVGTVTHSGDYFWMTVDPGTNSFTLAGGGSVVVSSYGAYL